LHVVNRSKTNLAAITLDSKTTAELKQFQKPLINSSISSFTAVPDTPRQTTNL
jgi:hypothetical protein